VANPEDHLQVASIIPPPDVVVKTEPTQVAIAPGKEVEVTVHITRENGFRGRVPCDVVNLPPGVRVVNLGLNGVLVTESEDQHTFALRAEDWAKPVTQPIYVVAHVESNATTEHASPPIALRVEGQGKEALAATQTLRGNSAAPSDHKP